MSTPVHSILRAATRDENEPLNILTAPTHEAYETGLAKTGHRFWAYRSKHVKDWSTDYRPCPENYVLLNPELGEQQLPPDVEFDVVLAQNIFGQYQILRPIADKLQLPLIRIEHTLPVPSWTPKRLREINALRGDINLFISEFSRDAWGFSKKDARVLHHGIDTETFKPDLNISRRPHLLSVVNDWMNRDWCCGFNFWKQATEGMPTRPIGATPGLSEPAKSLSHLVREYQHAQIFINTSLVSPVPTALMEAMACGCAVISTNTCMIPSVIQNGVNGILVNSPEEMRGAAQQLLDDKELCEELGQEARRTIEERFGLDRFISEWDAVLREAADIVYTGEGR